MSDSDTAIPLVNAVFNSPPAADYASGRLACLQLLGLALTAAVTVQQTADVVIAEGFAALNAAAGSLYLLEAEAEDGAGYFVRKGTAGRVLVSHDERLRLPFDAPDPLPSAARQRQPLFIETPSLASDYALPPAYFPAEPPSGALAALPLYVEDRVVGGIELHWAQARAFDADTRVFMQVVAQICAQAVERARLYEAEQQARQIAERAEQRTALLQSITARLSQALSTSQIAEVIVDAVAETLDAHRGVLALLTSEGDRLEVARAFGYRPELAQVWQQFALSAPIPLADVTRTGEPVWIHDLTERDARYPQLARIHTTSHAYAVLPLLAQSRVLGAISFGFDHARAFEEGERAFIVTIAQQCAQALERAGLHDETTRTLAHIETLNARLRRSMAETHHRVKNNLQVISALVELQTDPATTIVPVDALRRIGIHARALATLHDLLTDQAKSNVEINVVSARALLGKMIPLLQTTAGERPIDAQIEDMRLPVRIGASLCLLTNELVSNAVKHGGKRVSLRLISQPLMPEQETGDPPASSTPSSLSAGLSASDLSASEVLETQLEAAFALVNESEENPDGSMSGNAGAQADPARPTRLVSLEIADDGPGFPDGFNARTAANTGLDLVANISRLDLSGQVAYANRAEGGAQVTITFPLPIS